MPGEEQARPGGPGARSPSCVLVADIGGTNARFAVVRASDGGLGVIDEITYPSESFASLSEALAALEGDSEAVREIGRACFGIAGPIQGNRCAATNLPWVIDGEHLAEVLGLAEVPLLNDLEAAAWGLGQVEPRQVVTVQEGVPQASGNRALLSAGTGLGEAALLSHGDGYLPYATEGGHADFAPGDELQVELWRYLSARHGHVSWERVLSGPGLVALFRFLLARDGAPEPDWLAGEGRAGAGASAITARARGEGCARCRAAIELFLDLLAAEAGNLALRTLATGGVYLAGGTVRHLSREIDPARFRATFAAKGRFRPLLETVPVHVVTDERLGLRGAATWAMRES